MFLYVSILHAPHILILPGTHGKCLYYIRLTSLSYQAHTECVYTTFTSHPHPTRHTRNMSILYLPHIRILPDTHWRRWNKFPSKWLFLCTVVIEVSENVSSNACTFVHYLGGCSCTYILSQRWWHAKWLMRLYLVTDAGGICCHQSRVATTNIAWNKAAQPNLGHSVKTLEGILVVCPPQKKKVYNGSWPSKLHWHSNGVFRRSSVVSWTGSWCIAWKRTISTIIIWNKLVVSQVCS